MPYVYSALVKCPKCGKSLYGVPMRGRKRKKDGTLYPSYYSYACRSDVHNNGIKCGFGQISCGIIDKDMSSIISQIADCEARMESIKRQQLTKESVCESLKIFDEFFDKMNDYEKKAFVNTFIKSIELYPDKSRKNGCPIKTVHFRFPVAYSGETVYDFSPPLSTTVDRLSFVITVLLAVLILHE